MNWSVPGIGREISGLPAGNPPILLAIQPGLDELLKIHKVSRTRASELPLDYGAERPFLQMTGKRPARFARKRDGSEPVSRRHEDFNAELPFFA